MKAEAERIRAGLDTIDATLLQPLERARRAWLIAHVASAQTRLDMIGGARRPFREEARRLRAHANLHFSRATIVLARLEALVPGDGPLSERIEAFRNRYTVPKDRLNAVMDAAIAECRKRTLAHRAHRRRALHDGVRQRSAWERVQLVQGRQLADPDQHRSPHRHRPRDRAGCHEGYPGHHVQGMNNERLYRDRGWVEFSIAPLYAP